MYSKIFFLIILCKKVLSDDEEINEKYIDLLPEEEKQEFLNTIARRILEGIRSNKKVTPNESHVDITDDQLDAQDAFVKEILKEESENFKNNMRRTDNNQEVDVNQRVSDDKAVLNTGDIVEIMESQRRQSENAKVDKIDRFQLDNDDRTENNNRNAEFNNGDKEEHVDLTLREGKRQKRKDGDSDIEAEITTETSYDVIPVKTIYDEDNDNVKIINEPGTISVTKNIELKVDQEGNSSNKKEGPVSEVGTSSNLILATNDSMSGSVNDTDKIDGTDNLRDEEITLSSLRNESNVEVSNDDLHPKSNQINDSENLRKSFHRTVGDTKMKDFQPSDAYFKNTHGYDINDDTTLLPITYTAEFTVSTDDDNNRLATQNIHEKELQGKTTEVNLYVTNNEVTPTELDKVTISEYNSKRSHNDSGIPEINNITSSNEDHPLKKPENTTKFSVFYNTSPKYTSITFGNYVEVIKHKITTDSALQNHSSEVNEVNNVQKKEVNNKKILRARFDDDSSQVDEYEPLQKAEDSKEVKVYEVYEVGSAQPHFVSTGEEKQNEHPLYVPVYNYAPENAYFKPYNKFGPNVEDMKKQDIPDSSKEEYAFKILPNTRNRFSGYGYYNKGRTYDKKIYETNSNRNKNAMSLSDDFVKALKEKLSYHNIYYNVLDYADLDYYYGRILRRDNKRSNAYNKNQDIKKGHEKKLISDSNDADSYSISSIHKSDKIKDHLRALRKILYLKNNFTYVPKSSENGVNKAYLYPEASDKPKTNSISIDYYFGRADSDEKPIDMSNAVYRLKNKEIKQSDLDFSPLTPNPLNFGEIPKNLAKKTIITDKDSYSITQEISNVPFKNLFEALLVVLKDSIQVKNENLVKYNWLKTTVNIQAAMRKLLDLIEQLKYGEYIHPKDLELIKYTIYIFKSSKTTLDRERKNKVLNKLKSTELSQRAKKKNTVQKMPKATKITKIKQPIKLWKNFATFLRSDEIDTERTKYKLLDEFEDLLRRILYNLHDLHDTIKHIATITEYKNQNWFKNLNDLYLSKRSNKNLAKVMLHLSLSKLLDSIEDSSVHGVEDNFRSFVKMNREDVKKSKEECLLVLKILEELKRMKN